MLNLQRIRNEVGLSQSQLARESRVNVRTIQDYERGARDINKAAAETVYQLALALGCKMEDIIEK